MPEKEEDFFDETYELLKNYSDDRLLLLKIQAAKKTGKAMSKIVFIVIAAMLLFFLLFFVSIMMGYYFADLTGSMYKGFSIVAGIYLALFLLFVVLFKSFISGRIMNMATAIFFEKNEQYESEDDEE